VTPGRSAMACATSGMRSTAALMLTIAVITWGPRGSVSGFVG
jgi:hypothetical protein